MLTEQSQYSAANLNGPMRPEASTFETSSYNLATIDLIAAGISKGVAITTAPAYAGFWPLLSANLVP